MYFEYTEHTHTQLMEAYTSETHILFKDINRSGRRICYDYVADNPLHCAHSPNTIYSFAPPLPRICLQIQCTPLGGNEPQIAKPHTFFKTFRSHDSDTHRYALNMFQRTSHTSALRLQWTHARTHTSTQCVSALHLMISWISNIHSTFTNKSFNKQLINYTRTLGPQRPNRYETGRTNNTRDDYTHSSRSSVYHVIGQIIHSNSVRTERRQSRRDAD